MKQPFDLWGQRGWAGQEVVGESQYGKEIRALFGAQYNPDGSEMEATVQLIPEPQNRYDRNAVSVRCGGTVVGYLPREDATRYVGVLSGLVAQGWIPQVTARIWGGDRSTYDYDRRGNPVEGTEFVGSVRIDLAEPHMLVPANLPPDGLHAMLPVGHAIQVTGEEGHMNALTPLLSSDGECWIYATLHELVEQTARTTRTVVEVRVDGAPVGKLTPKMSSELLPAVRHVAELGAQTGARAILKGNRVKADVVLYVARANELPQAWLDQPPLSAAERWTAGADLVAEDRSVRVGGEPEPATPAAAPTQRPPVAATTAPTAYWRFNPPPGWPQPPEGWVPPAGWRPDSTWPPAPPAWQFWIRTSGATVHGQVME